MSFDTDTESYAGDDPTGAGDTGVGYGSTGVDTAGNPTDGSVLSRTGFKNAMGITDTNPFGFKGPFSAIFGINPKNIDYSNIFGPDEREALIDQRFGLYSNPQNQPGFGYNPNVPTVTTGVREGLTRGFGSLFGSPVGIPTVRGQVAAQRSKDPMGSAMMGAFSALAPMSLPTLFAQAIGRDTYTTKGAPDYDPTKDPDSPSFTGPSSMGGIVDALSVLGTGMTTTTGQEVYGAAKEAVQDALDYFSNPRGGIEVTAEKTEMPAGTALGKSPAVEIEELEPVGSLNNMFSPQGYSTVNTIGDITRDPLKEEAERIRDKLGY